MRAWSGSRIHTTCHTVHHTKKTEYWINFRKTSEFLSNLCAWNKNLELKTSNNGEKMNKKTIVLWARLFTKKKHFTNLASERGSPTPETDPVTQKSISNGLTRLLKSQRGLTQGLDVFIRWLKFLQLRVLTSRPKCCRVLTQICTQMSILRAGGKYEDIPW